MTEFFKGSVKVIKIKDTYTSQLSRCLFPLRYFFSGVQFVTEAEASILPRICGLSFYISIISGVVITAILELSNATYYGLATGNAIVSIIITIGAFQSTLKRGLITFRVAKRIVIALIAILFCWLFIDNMNSTSIVSKFLQFGIIPSIISAFISISISQAAMDKEYEQ